MKEVGLAEYKAKWFQFDEHNKIFSKVIKNWINLNEEKSKSNEVQVAMDSLIQTQGKDNKD